VYEEKGRRGASVGGGGGGDEKKERSAPLSLVCKTIAVGGKKEEEKKTGLSFQKKKKNQEKKKGGKQPRAYSERHCKKDQNLGCSRPMKGKGGRVKGGGLHIRERVKKGGGNASLPAWGRKRSKV